MSLGFVIVEVHAQVWVVTTHVDTVFVKYIERIFMKLVLSSLGKLSLMVDPIKKS